MIPQVSLFASSVRPELYKDFFNSLGGTSVDWEVKFSGPLTIVHWAEGLKAFGMDVPKMHYIPTKNIKPAQCYEIARRSCTGEVVVWVADDCEFPNDVIGKAFKYWKEQKDEKLILSLQTKETGYRNAKGSFFDMRDHSLVGFNRSTPLMAPIGMMSRKFLEDLGGLDRRYVCGQYENDIVMRAYAAGGRVEIFGGEACFVDIDHLGKSIKIGESVDENTFNQRPFAKGYATDRKVLEASWLPLTHSTGKGWQRHDEFEPFDDKDLTEKSQSNSIEGWD